MGVIRDLLQKLAERKARFKEMQDQDRFSDKIEERKQSSNERELNRFIKEEREKQIKAAVEQFREREHNEVWHGSTSLDTPNMFAHKNGSSLLKQRNLFVHKKSILNQKRMGY